MSSKEFHIFKASSKDIMNRWADGKARNTCDTGLSLMGGGHLDVVQT